MSRLQRIVAALPGASIIRGYRLADLPADLLSSLIVVLVLIPSAIAHADLARCPPAAGLYAALAGMVVFALFTSSRHVITGPDAAIALMVGAAVSSVAGDSPAQALAASTWLALLTGALLLLAAWGKLGAAADFLANPVMIGFMNGAALVIVLSQSGRLIGVNLTQDNPILRMHEWLTLVPMTHGPTLALGLAFMGILVALRIWLPRLPGAVVIFALAIVAGQAFDFSAHGMAVIGSVDTSWPKLVPPILSLDMAGGLAVSALGIALMVFPEGVVLGRSMAKKHGYTIHPDRELVALAAANLAAGLVHSFAVGASQTRTLLNDGTGGRTQVVSLFAALFLVVFMFYLAPWMAGMPTVTIAAILIFTGLTLIDTAAVQRLQKMRRADAVIAVLTSVGVVALGVLPGILLGVFLSLARLLGQVARPHDAILGRIPGADTFHDLGEDEHLHSIPGLVIYRFYGPLIFANVRYFTERLEQFIAREPAPVRQVLLDARAITEIDVTAAEELRTFIGTLTQRGIRFKVTKAHLPLREAAVGLGLEDWFSEQTNIGQLADAVADFESHFATRP